MINIPIDFITRHETIVNSETKAEVLFHDIVNGSISKFDIDVTKDKRILNISINNRSSDCKVYMDYFIDKLMLMDKEDLINFLKSKHGINKYKL